MFLFWPKELEQNLKGKFMQIVNSVIIYEHIVNQSILLVYTLESQCCFSIREVDTIILTPTSIRLRFSVNKKTFNTSLWVVKTNLRWIDGAFLSLSYVITMNSCCISYFFPGFFCKLLRFSKRITAYRLSANGCKLVYTWLSRFIS